MNTLTEIVSLAVPEHQLFQQPQRRLWFCYQATKGLVNLKNQTQTRIKTSPSATSTAFSCALNLATEVRQEQEEPVQCLSMNTFICSSAHHLHLKHLWNVIAFIHVLVLNNIQGAETSGGRRTWVRSPGKGDQPSLSHKAFLFGIFCFIPGYKLILCSPFLDRFGSPHPHHLTDMEPMYTRSSPTFWSTQNAPPQQGSPRGFQGISALQPQNSSMILTDPFPTVAQSRSSAGDAPWSCDAGKINLLGGGG